MIDVNCVTADSLLMVEFEDDSKIFVEALWKGISITDQNIQQCTCLTVPTYLGGGLNMKDMNFLKLAVEYKIWKSHLSKVLRVN